MPGHRSPRSVRELAPVEAAWIGAMIDGEGSIYRCTGQVGHRMEFGNTEVELVATMLRVVGAGKVYLLNNRASNLVGKLPIWRWYLYPANDVAALIEQIAPYSIKAQKWLPYVETV